MDYEGQRKAEKIYQIVIICTGVIGFVFGYVTQQLFYTMMFSLTGLFIACILTLPPWPLYRKNPLPWQKSKDSIESNKSSKKKK